MKTILSEVLKDYAPKNHNHDGTYQPAGSYASASDVAAIQAVVPSGATSSNKLVTNSEMQSAIGDIENALHLINYGSSS